MNGSDIQQQAGLAELAQRESDGIEATLMWERLTNRIVVIVDDARSGETFTVEARPENALDVFRHPFAYAARRSSSGTSVDLGVLVAD